MYKLFGVPESQETTPAQPDPAELIELACDAIVVRSPADQRIISWNRGAATIYGWEAAEVVGKPYSTLLQTEYPDGSETVERQLEADSHWEGILSQRHRDGHPIRVLARWAVHRDRSGRPDAVVEMNTDISDQTAIATRLGNGHAMFELLIANVQDYAIFMLDTSGHVATWNPGAARIKGYKASEIIGRHFSVFYPEIDVQAGKPDWELVVAADTGRFEDDGWRVRKDGSMFWANVVITALRDETGELRGFGKLTRDLTARREAELEKIERERQEAAAIRAHASRLADLEKTKTDFLNLASHELRAPLSVARGYMSMLLDGTLSPESFTRFAPLVDAKLGQIEWLVQKMLETARLEYDQLTLNVSEVDVVPLVHKQIDALRPLLGHRHQLLVEIDRTPLIVRGDADRLGTVVVNLLDNAVKYSPEGGEIGVRVAVGGGRVFISVSDQGVGIDPDDFPRLFTRFSRLEQQDVRGGDGTGLGLYIAREIARRHGGDIMVESRPRVGSRFTLSLPIADASAARRAG